MAGVSPPLNIVSHPRWGLIPEPNQGCPWRSGFESTYTNLRITNSFLITNLLLTTNSRLEYTVPKSTDFDIQAVLVMLFVRDICRFQKELMAVQIAGRQINRQLSTCGNEAIESLRYEL